MMESKLQEVVTNSGKDKAAAQIGARICIEMFQGAKKEIKEIVKYEEAIKYLRRKLDLHRAAYDGYIENIEEKWLIFCLNKIDKEVPLEQLDKIYKESKGALNDKIKNINIKLKGKKDGKEIKL